MTTSGTSLAFWPGPDHGGWAGEELRLSGWMVEAASSAAHSVGPRSSLQRILYCYAHERLARTLRDLVEVQRAACRVATERGYHLGPLFVEEDSSGRAMQALIESAAVLDGAAAVAVPHRGHFIPLGRPHEWQLFLEEMTGHPLVFTSHTQ